MNTNQLVLNQLLEIAKEAFKKITFAKNTPPCKQVFTLNEVCKYIDNVGGSELHVIKVDGFKCEFYTNQVFELLKKFSKLPGCKLPTNLTFSFIENINKEATEPFKNFVDTKKEYTDIFKNICIDHKEGFAVGGTPDRCKIKRIEQKNKEAEHFDGKSGQVDKMSSKYPNFLKVIPKEGYKINIDPTVWKNILKIKPYKHKKHELPIKVNNIPINFVKLALSPEGAIIYNYVQGVENKACFSFATGLKTDIELFINLETIKGFAIEAPETVYLNNTGLCLAAVKDEYLILTTLCGIGNGANVKAQADKLRDSNHYLHGVSIPELKTEKQEAPEPIETQKTETSKNKQISDANKPTDTNTLIKLQKPEIYNTETQIKQLAQPCYIPVVTKACTPEPIEAADPDITKVYIPFVELHNNAVCTSESTSIKTFATLKASKAFIERISLAAIVLLSFFVGRWSAPDTEANKNYPVELIASYDDLNIEAEILDIAFDIAIVSDSFKEPDGVQKELIRPVCTTERLSSDYVNHFVIANKKASIKMAEKCFSAERLSKEK